MRSLWGRAWITWSRWVVKYINPIFFNKLLMQNVPTENKRLKCGRNCKPDFVLALNAIARMMTRGAGAIIPLGEPLLARSCSLPESHRTGPVLACCPTLLFGLAPRGVCRAPNVAIRAVSFYLAVSPLPAAVAFNRGGKVSLPSATEALVSRRSVFCGTFRSPAILSRFTRINRRIPWRYQARCPAESGLSSRRARLPVFTGRCAARDHPLRPQI